jgi:transposase-like protein
MIQVTIKHTCRACQSANIVKNGRNASGNQQYRCKGCGACKVLEPTVRYGAGRKEEILRAYQERASLRGVCRVFGVSRPTVSAC